MKKLLYKLCFKANNVLMRWITCHQKRNFARCGENVYIGKYGTFFYPSCIFIGNYVHIGEHAFLMSTLSNIYIDDYVMLGPHVTIIGGDHRIGVIGKHLYEVKDKLPENDRDVHIRKGCWIGCNATILKGVTVSRGTVVAAGSVVTRNTLPYSIVGGVPAKFIKFYWSIDEILEHEEKLYAPEERFSREYLEAVFEKYCK